MDADRMRKLVRNWQGVELEHEAAERLATLSLTVRKSLDAVAGGSLFDTEPAHYERTQADLAGGSNG